MISVNSYGDEASEDVLKKLIDSNPAVRRKCTKGYKLR